MGRTERLPADKEGTEVSRGKRLSAGVGGGSQSMAGGLRSEAEETRSLFAWLWSEAVRRPEAVLILFLFFVLVTVLHLF
jgi:hypothetical protein